MATEDENRWSWFCHETNISSEAGDDGAYMSECTVNFAAFLLHLLFVIIACLVLIWRRWWCVFREVTSPYLIKWPGHNTRWVLSFILVVLAFASLGEGILTEMARKEPSPQLQFYLPACLLLIATIISMLYYQLAENWKSPGLLWLLLAYWFFCFVINVVRITHLLQENVAGIDAAVLWIAVLMLVSYILLLVLEVHLVALEEYKTSIGKSPSVWKVFLRVFKGEIFWAGIIRLIYDLTCLVGPLALNGVVAYAIAYGDEVREPFLNSLIYLLF
ncbi:ATP-binding cassette sub-family C member 9-like isoform X2 [Amphiura filiformis]|uniref:ATP-binding cassette sub-family C member 9-like isoform X2 n=1 Tax=Amphiura filiformis TaxID=82378 RepID=UPI003B22213B